MSSETSERKLIILLEQARQLAFRLERLSADSIWARRASGTRGSLLRYIDHLEQALGGSNPWTPDEAEVLELVMQHSSQLLEAGARELLAGRTGWRRRTR